MDDQAQQQPKKTDHTMVEAFAKPWVNHPSFKAGATASFLLWLIITTVPSLILSKDSWIEIGRY